MDTINEECKKEYELLPAREWGISLEKLGVPKEMKAVIMNIVKKNQSLELQNKILISESLDRIENPNIFIKLRPLLVNELNEDLIPMELVDNNINIMVSNEKILHYEFPNIFNDRKNSEQILYEIEYIFSCIENGYNISLFTYGQKNTGKTFVLFGSEGNEGIISKTLKNIMRRCKLEMMLSIIEVEDDEVFDILKEEYGIIEYERTEEFITLQNVTMKMINNFEDIKYIVDKGRRRRMEQYERNTSHCIVKVEIKILGSSGTTMNSSVSFIDMAGSDMLLNSDNKLSEINNYSVSQSISAIGAIYASLRDKIEYFPFNKSLLSLILKPCFLGKSKTIMLCNISQLQRDIAETVFTLDFANYLTNSKK